MKHSSIRKAAALGTVGLTLVVLSGCSGALGGGGSDDSGDVINIGYVSPQTGALAAFGEADTFVLDKMAAYFEENGITLADGSKHEVNIVSKDTQSDSKRASDVATELILEDNVQMILVSSAPETVNPVSDQCEANQVLCISTVAPWQAWYFGRGGTPDKGFDWTYHFFWGLDDVLPVYNDMWQAASDTSKLAVLFPNDSDGAAWNDAATGLPPFAASLNMAVTNPGLFADGSTDYSAQIAQYKADNDAILSAIANPPDFVTFWKQAVQQGYNPEIATVAKAVLFPSVVESLGDLGDGLATEVWWAPSYPYSSSLTGQSAQELADEFTEETGKQWTQPIGFAEALFEVANAVLTQSDSTDAEDLREVMSTLKTDTVVGPLDWTSGPVPGVAVTPVVGGQWRLQDDGKYELVIVSNKLHPEIPAGGTVEPIDWTDR
jgi:branched-chain amino acid transport system substrate-binding protein